MLTILQELRREQGITQLELAWRSRLSVTAISRLEREKAKINPKAAQDLNGGLVDGLRGAQEAPGGGGALTLEELREGLAKLGVLWDGERAWVEDPRAFMKEIARRTNPKPDPWAERFFARDAKEVDPRRIEPELELVEDERQGRIFRHALSFWSVPVSAGCGRRLRYIVWDRGNGKVMGIFGLSDPVAGLSVRDRFIGWDMEARKERLYHVMTAYVLGAVPPYGTFLGGKLVALLAGSDQVRADLRRKYAGKVRLAELVLIDTMGAFGKSAVYNRLKGWRFVGYTKGYTYYHLRGNGVYEGLIQVLREAGREEVLRGNRYGHGPHWTFRVLREALRALGVPRPKSLLQLGLTRGYYVYPLAANFREFLRGEAKEPTYLGLPEEELIRYWKEGWLAKRLGR